MNKITIVIFTVLLFTSAVNAQLEDRLNILDESEVKNFARPLVTSFTSGMSAGAFNTAAVPKYFGFSIGVRAMYIFIPDDQRSFTPNLPDGYLVDKDAPTIYGPETGVTYIGGGSNPPIVYPGGLDLKAFPIAFPQVTLSFFSTELLFRYVPLPLDDEDLTLLGLGLKHDVGQYIPLLPLDLAVQVLYNKLEVSDIVDATHMAYGLIASKSFALLTVYGGIQYETSSFDFSYEFTEENRNINVEIEGDNDVRGVLGLALNFPFIVINADYSLGAQNVLSTGLSLQF
ncbi:MAG TPA: DUF6588 family protein [Ignavibacteriales bacterium]|nr:DUF6588 family protein [Ignavibacteriales bacterium]